MGCILQFCNTSQFTYTNSGYMNLICIKPYVHVTIKTPATIRVDHPRHPQNLPAWQPLPHPTTSSHASSPSSTAVTSHSYPIFPHYKNPLCPHLSSPNHSLSSQFFQFITMASNYTLATLLSSLLLFSLFFTTIFGPTIASSRKLTALVQEQPLTMKYHNGALLKGNITLNLIWYGKFTPIQRSIIVDYLQSHSFRRAPLPSVASWWKTTEKYHGGTSTLVVGKQILDENYSLGKSLKNSHIVLLASKLGHVSSVNIVLTAKDVAVDGFCMSRCGTHGSTRGKTRFAYAWVGNSETQCPGQCAWPFHQPIYGPQTPPLVAPNGDVGVDGMIINLATVLAGAVTNPFNNGYFQGPATAPLEAVSACTGVFGSGSYPGYPGNVLVEKTTGASYNAYGANGRKYLLPAMWDPKTSTCSTLV